MKRTIIFTFLLSILILCSGTIQKADADQPLSQQSGLLTSPPSPGTTSNMVAVGAFGGSIQTFTISGDYAYASEGMNFVVLDISTPTNPVKVGQTLLPDQAWQIVVDGDYAYIADWSKGLQIVDISDPTNPEVVASWWDANSSYWAYGIAVSGGYAYLGGAYGRLMVFDISDPTSPVHGTDVLGTDFNARQMMVNGGYLYISGNQYGLVIFNLSTPSAPSYVTSFNPGGYGYTMGLQISGDYAYVADGTYGLRIVDISTPSSPSQVGKYPPEGYAHSGSFEKVSLDGDYAYLADGEQGLWVVDVSTVTAPAEHSYLLINNGVEIVQVDGSHVFTNNHFKVFNTISGTNPPSLATEYTTLYDISELNAKDDLLLASARWGLPLYAVNISNPAKLRKIATYDDLDGSDAIQIVGNKAYVAGGGSGIDFRVLDLSTPGEIHYDGTLTTAGDASRLSASGSLAFIGDGSNGVVVANVSNPGSPTQLDSYDTNYANDLAYGDGYVYVADGSGDILILDATNPADLSYLTAYGITSNKVQLWGNYLVARGTQYTSFSIVDVEDPTNPTLLSTTFTSLSNGIVDIALQDDMAYVLGTYSGSGGSGSSLLVYDISNPTSPGFRAQYDMPVGATRVTVSGRYSYVGLGYRGLLAIKLLYPRIDEVTPIFGPAGYTNPISIFGEGFAAGATVTIGSTPAISSTVVTEYHVEALLPSTIPAGEYDVRVENPGGYGDTEDDAYTLLDTTVEGVYANPKELFTTPAPPRSTEPATLALHVHRIGGTGDLTGYTVDFYEGNPDRGGTLIGIGTVATLPPDGSGTTSAVAWTPSYAMDTHIYAVLGTSDVKVHRLITVLPSSSDPNPPTVNSVTINGGTCCQDTASKTVNLQVNASDVGSGVNSMWVAEFMWNPGLGSWQLINESGWVPYQRNSQWKLTGSPGSRFIDVWVADFAGNISNLAKTAHINLLYTNMWVAQNQTHIFNYDLTVGEHVETQLIPASSDADLYIGTYDDGILYRSYEAGNVVETIIFDAPSTDWYSFIAYGYTSATYSIIINRAGSSHAPGAVTDKTPPGLLSPQGGPPTQMGLPNAPIEDPNFPIYLPLIIR